MKRILLCSVALLMTWTALAQQANVTYQYDALGRITKATYGNGSEVAYSYDAAGNRTTVTAAVPPDAVNDSITTNEDTAFVFDPRTNDTGQNLIITAKTDGSKGSVAIISSGTQLQYTPYSNQNGSDSFTYTLSNGVLTDVATVSVTINPVNDAPTAGNDSISVIYNTPYTFDPRGNDTDVEGSTLTITNKNQCAQGVVTIVGGGTQLTYTPNAGATGADSFTYTVSDGGLTSTATVSLTISTNSPPVAVNDSVSTNEDTATTFDPRSNDSDPNGQTLTIVSKTDGAKGTVAIVSGGTQLTYTPYANQNGADSFTYTISDGYVTATATVSMTINPVNDPPTANNDSISVTYQTAYTFDPRTNDTDIDSTLTITAKTDGAKGTVAIVSGGTQLTYTPGAGKYGADSFTYTVSDGTTSVSATVTVNIPVEVVRQSNGTINSPWVKQAVAIPPYTPTQMFIEQITRTSPTATACSQSWQLYGTPFQNYPSPVLDSLFDCGVAGPAVPTSGGVSSGYYATGNGKEIIKPQ